MAGEYVNIATKETATALSTALVQRAYMLIPLILCENESQAGNEFLRTCLASNYENLLVIDCTKGGKLAEFAWVNRQVLRVEVSVVQTL